MQTSASLRKEEFNIMDPLPTLSADLADYTLVRVSWNNAREFEEMGLDLDPNDLVLTWDHKKAKVLFILPPKVGGTLTLADLAQVKELAVFSNDGSKTGYFRQDMEITPKTVERFLEIQTKYQSTAEVAQPKQPKQPKRVDPTGERSMMPSAKKMHPMVKSTSKLVRDKKVLEEEKPSTAGQSAASSVNVEHPMAESTSKPVRAKKERPSTAPVHLPRSSNLWEGGKKVYEGGYDSETQQWRLSKR